jgi:hypothetical protein
MAPEKVTPAQLADAARAALGGGRRLTRVERLAGGTRKGVYRLTMDDAMTAIAYLWEESENYWPTLAGDNDDADPFSAGVGLHLYEAAHARMAALGLRVPAIYLIDREHAYRPADLAVVEDFPGEPLVELFDRDPAAAEPIMARLETTLAMMRAHRAPAYGKLAYVDGGGTPPTASCEVAARDFGLRCLAEAAGRDQRIADANDRLAQRLHELTAVVPPRAEYSVVHGELWGHVLIDPAGEPVLIDIEDLMYFDVEWEHVFLQIRLGAGYPRLAVPGLDQARMALYMLVQRLSLTAGPLRLLDGDFPRRDFMRGIAERNLNQALSLIN